MKILIINGPNLNLLGMREPDIYGHQSYAALEGYILRVCRDADMEGEVFQSNYEGAIVEKIQQAYGTCDGILINPAAYTHTSVAILDALKAVALPAVEVHLSHPEHREEFRRFSYTALACEKSIQGLGFEGYRQGVLYLKQRLAEKDAALGTTQS